jgi:hypothetical protein
VLRLLDIPDPLGPEEVEETDDPVYADQRSFFKVECWTAYDHRVAQLAFAGNRLERARQIFYNLVRRHPGSRFTIRQRSRVFAEWPERGIWTLR